MSVIIQPGTPQYFGGCWTFETAIIGCTLLEIGRRLGLPASALRDGIDIYGAYRIPEFDEFDWGAMTDVSTDKFIDYKNGTGYNLAAFVKLFEKNVGKKITSKDIHQLKQEWHGLMAGRKLVKVVPINKDIVANYPKGSSFTPQFILKRKLESFLGATVLPNGVFRNMTMHV